MSNVRRFDGHFPFNRKFGLLCSLMLCALCSGSGVQAGPVDTPPAPVVTEAQRLVQEMIQDSRGPYSKILWYCNDGTTQAPVAYACKERGGGRQHAAYSPRRVRLAELGWSVGTIYAGTSFEELFDSRPRQQRLRELALERYLIDVDDGWVLRRAQNYRGRVQLEDEVVAGRALLLRLLEDSAWVAANHLLLRELIRVIPHGEDSDLSRRVRRAATELAERDPAAEQWRAEIHSSPSTATATKLRDWASAVNDVDTKVAAIALADDLDLLYGDGGRLQRLTDTLAAIQKMPALKGWRKNILQQLEKQPQARLSGLCQAVADARAELLAKLQPAQQLAVLDAMDGLETEARFAFNALIPDQDLSRADLLRLSSSVINCAYGAGLVSAGERAAIDSALASGAQNSIPLQQYQAGILQLKRVPAWAAGNVRYAFAEALARYTALDSRAARFTDDLLRGSPVWMLGDTLRLLSRDLGELSDIVVEAAGQTVNTAIALNQGLARGTLRIFETLEAAEAAQLLPTDIVVLPETIAELKPVAGILTLGEGNALSHVQLLARNFGIPNVAIDQATVDLIRSLQGRSVVLIVGPGGNVIFRAAEDAGAIGDLFAKADSLGSSTRIAVPAPNLSQTEILRLQHIERTLSGKVIGPKAANLGQLNRLFPGRVSPAIAIPFGVYAEQLESHGLMPRIRAVYADFGAGTLSREALDSELAGIRTEISALRLSDDVASRIRYAMQQEFGGLEGYGVFVRSDTNVEDLPEFTGAGLSETVPNVVGLENQLSTVPRVWASVLSQRALAWRSSLLSNPDQVYASVLLMKSVASDKSGVLVVANLIDPLVAGLTASTAWGVGGAVAGEAAESIVILPDSIRLVSEAKSAYRRKLSESGGIEWLPAASGAVLEAAEIEQLRGLAQEVLEKYEPVLDHSGKARPWDIEFGFVAGKLTLFQIRPLVEKSTQRALDALRILRPEITRPTSATSSVDLRAKITGKTP